MNHTPGHRDCEACRKKAYSDRLEIAKEALYPEAAEIWIKSREFAAGSERSRFVTARSLADFHEYNKPLSRFFGQLPIREIHLGHVREYQEERTAGLLGPTPEELLPRFADRLAKKLRQPVEDVLADPQAMAIVKAEMEAYPRHEVSPNKVNQEVGMLIRILKLAGVWTSIMDEKYEALRYVESDIPRALTPEEQETFLSRARELYEFIYCFAILGIDCVLSTIEERRLKIGDLNINSGVVLVRSASAKNKYRIRTIPFTAEALWAAERLLERAASLGSTAPQHHLFPFRVVRGIFDPNRPMSVQGAKYQWNEVRRAAGVPWFTPYGLRHTGCTRYAESGISIHVLLSMAGHMTRKMQQHYIHISEAAKRLAVEKLRPQSLHPVAPKKVAIATKA